MNVNRPDYGSTMNQEGDTVPVRTRTIDNSEVLPAIINEQRLGNADIVDAILENRAHPAVSDSVIDYARQESEMTDCTMNPDTRPLVPGSREAIGTTRTLMNFLKGMIGPGCLALPAAFKTGGLWMGLALTLGLGALNCHCMSILVECAQYLCKKSGKPDLDYGHLAKKIVDYQMPTSWRRHSRKALYFTNLVIGILQIGVCAVGFTFMGSQLHYVIQDYTQLDDPITIRQGILIMLVPELLINCIRSVAILSILGTIGNFLMIAVLGIISYSVFTTPAAMGEGHLPAVTTPLNVSIAIGSILYAFEGQAMVLPMENTMKYPVEMLGGTGVLTTGMTIVSCIYAATGYYGYRAYGKNTQASITFNLDNNFINDGAKLMLVTALYLGYAFQYYVVVEMLWPAIRRKLKKIDFNPAYFLPLEYAFRFSVVILSFILAICVSDLELIISVVGTSAGMLLALIFPALFDTVTFWEDWIEVAQRPEASRWQRMRPWVLLFKNVSLIALGMFGLVVGLYANLK